MSGFQSINPDLHKKTRPYVTVLGIAQDAGYPQINCEKSCCEAYFKGLEPKKLTASIGLVDLKHDKKWLFDATPDLVAQTQILKKDHLNNTTVIS